MKRMIVFMVLMIAAFAAFAQVPDSTQTVIVSADSFNDFLHKNAWWLVFFVVGAVDAFIAQTPKLKESALFMLIWNMVAKLVYKKGQIKSVKGKYMTQNEILKSKGL